MKKICLVTGGLGFIGSATVYKLLKRGDSVVILDEVNDYYDPMIKILTLLDLLNKYKDTLKIYIGDICNEELLIRIWKETRFNVVVHLAARAGVRPSLEDPQLYVHSNVRGMVALLEISKRLLLKDKLLFPNINNDIKENCDGNDIKEDCDVKHANNDDASYKFLNFCYASSSSVYGSCTTIPFNEDFKLDCQISPYAATKKSCENLAYTYSHLYDLPVSGYRFFTVYGPSGRPDMAPFKFMHRVYNEITIEQYGDGTSKRDYTYIDDIVNGVLLSIDKPMKYEVYNLGKGSPVVLSDFIKKIEEVVGKKAKIKVVGMKPGDVDLTYADVSKAKKILGYNPQIDIDEGLKRTADWYINIYSKVDRSKVVIDTSNPNLTVVTDEYNTVSKYLRDCSIDSKDDLTANIKNDLNTKDKNDCKGEQNYKVSSCTRIHVQNVESTTITKEMGKKLVQWTQSALEYSQHVGIAVDTTKNDDLLNSVKKLLGNEEKVDIIGVSPWNKFVPALNALVSLASEKKSTHIFFQSLEVNPTKEQAKKIIESFNDKQDLFVGPVIKGFQKFSLGLHKINGTNIPYNTCGLWNVGKLSKTGFLMISEGLFDGHKSAGIEEVATVTIHQKLFPNQSRVKLIQMESNISYGERNDEKHESYHQKKLETKRTRANKQIGVLGIENSGVVHHVK